MEPKVQILVSSAWSNTERGNFFEDIVAEIYKQMQFRVTQRIRVTGMEIDLLAEQIHTKEKAYIECKFLSEPFGAPVISKLIGNAIQEENIDTAFLVSTAEPGKDAKGSLKKHDEKNNVIRGVLRFGFIGPSQLIELYLTVNQYPTLLERLAVIDGGKDISAATLVVTPDEACWVLEYRTDGIPSQAFAVPLRLNEFQLKNYEGFKRLVDDNKMWSGLRILDGLSGFERVSQSSVPAREVVTRVPVADKFDDYGPARPEDFVGRIELQQEIFRFLANVRNNKTQKRTIALSGPSGFGKSSVVLKLADRARNKRYRNRFRIYHVDSRSATSPLFVVEAIRTVFQEAIAENFIELPDTQISIDSVEDPFSSTSILNCLSDLKKQQRVLVIFFDQFEELLTKEMLFSTFEIFKKTAFLVEAIQPNLVLGFSWRTGISFSEDHPAYHMWHSLQDKRAEFKIGLFSSQEASEMCTILERNLKEKLEVSLRRHLLEQAQGFPWLLKKFCIHVYRQLYSGTDQRSLVGRQLDAAILFEEDTQDLTSNELACLRYIAEHSPVDLVEVHELFETAILDHLYYRRLIIKSGHRYSVYWDIFREYLVTNKVPNIPMTFFPQAQLSTSLSVLRYIIREGPVTIEQIDEDFKYTTKTIWNIVGDLSTFFLISRNNSGEFEAVNEIEVSSNLEEGVANYVREQLEKHVVLDIFQDNVQPRESISQTELEYATWEVYPSFSLATLRVYINRLLTWLRFTGLVEFEPPGRFIRPVGYGKEQGKVIIRHSRTIEGKALFLCTSSPARVIELATELYAEKRLSREYILNTEGRNAAQDLSALGLAQWRNKAIHPSERLASITGETEEGIRNQCATLVKNSALGSKFLQTLATLIKQNPDQTDAGLAEAISYEFGRDWRPTSAIRYIGSGRRWLEFFGELQKILGQLSLFDY